MNVIRAGCYLYKFAASLTLVTRLIQFRLPLSLVGRRAAVRPRFPADREYPALTVFGADPMERARFFSPGNRKTGRFSKQKAPE